MNSWQIIEIASVTHSKSGLANLHIPPSKQYCSKIVMTSKPNSIKMEKVFGNVFR